MELVDCRNQYVRDAIDRHDLGAGMAIVWPVDVALGPHFEHVCSGWEDDDGTDVRKLVAPSLANHEHPTSLPADVADITVRPSVLCPDCDLHGWITGGRWVLAG